MRRVLALGVLTLALVGAPAVSARDVTVPTATEAWYATLPSLTAPPAGTLHVGVTAGLEDSRTYLSLDLGAVPSDADLTSGLLTLPVDTAGSQAPEAALIDVCLAPDPGPSVEGSTDPAPEADCSVNVRAVHAGDAFTLDLAPFLPRLRGAGLALLPAVTPATSWHVSFWSRASESPDARPITATLTFADEEPAVVAPPEPSEPADEVASPFFSGEGTGFAEPERPSLPPAAEPVDEEVGRPSLGVAPPLPTAPTRYADSLVFALPLVLLALVGYFGSALTRPIVLDPAAPVSPAEGQRARRRAPLRALAARERRAGG